MPNLTTTELAVVAACFVFFWTVPGVLNMVNERRRLAAERRSAELLARTMAAMPPEEASTGGASPTDDGSATPAADAPSAPIAAASDESSSVEVSSTGAPLSAWSPDEWHDFAIDDTGRRQPVRFGDLRPASLGNWPPEEVRRNPDRARLWLEAERVAARYAAMLEATEFSVPLAVRACCFAGGEQAGSVWRLRFLLFSELWPEQEDQAEAFVEFELGSESEPARARVATRRR